CRLLGLAAGRRSAAGGRWCGGHGSRGRDHGLGPESSAGLRVRGLGLDLFALPDLVEAFDNDPISGLEPLRHDPEGADALCQIDLSDIDAVVGADHSHLMLALHVTYGSLGNQQRALPHLHHGPHLGELTRAQELLRIREDTTHTDRAGGDPDLPVYDLGRAAVWVHRAVREDDLEVLFPIDLVLRGRPLPPLEIVLLGEADLDVERIDLGDRGQHRARGDEVADVRLLDPRDAGDG